MNLNMITGKILLFLFLLYVPVVSAGTNVGSCPVAVVVCDDDKSNLIEVGNEMLEEIRGLADSLSEAEAFDEVKELMAEMEKLLKTALKKYKNDLSSILRNADEGDDELKQLLYDIELAVKSFFKAAAKKIADIGEDL